MKKILIIGASSAIANESAREWAKGGAELFLVARSEEKLKIISTDLRVRGASEVSTFCMDLNNLAQAEEMLEKVFMQMGCVDIALIAHGTLSHQKKCENSVESTLFELKTNAISTIAILTLLANRLEAQKKGVIAVISSVAGDRGRQSNYVYGSAKAMLTTFCSGLRQRLSKSGCSVITIKPGFVDTPMTAEFKKSFIWASSDSVGKSIVTACNSKNGEVYIPGFWLYIMTIIKLTPNIIFNRLKL